MEDKIKQRITLREFLLHMTEEGDLITINSNGWTVGSAIIDPEDLFIRSISNELLEREVKEVKVGYIYINQTDIKDTKYKQKLEVREACV